MVADDRLGVRARLGYGVGDLGINFYFQSALTYLLFFYTDVFGITPAAAAAVFLVARVVDAVTDPMMGAIADRTRSRWGHLRPYILFGPIPLALITIATFSTPDLDHTGKVVWAYATYISFGIAYTVVTIPYSALTAALTRSAQERTTLSTVRMFFAFAGGLVVSVGTLPLVGLFADPRTGFQWTVACYAIVATALLWITFAATSDASEPAREERVPLLTSLRALGRNPPLWIVIGMFTLGMLAFTVRQTASLYYFKYNLGREDLVPLFFGVSMPFMIAGLAAVPWLARRVGKAGGIMVGAALSIASAAGLYLTPYARVDLVFGFSILGALGGAPIAVLGWAMIPDTVEFAQWKTGVRAEATVYSTASFFQKLAKAVGGAGAAAALAATGFVANTDQSPEALWAILALMTLVPIAIMICVIGIAALYRLDDDAHAQIVRALETSPD